MCGSTRAASDKMLIRIDYPSMNAAGSDVMQGFVWWGFLGPASNGGVWVVILVQK